MLGALSTGSGSRVLADLNVADRAEVLQLFRSMRARHGFLRESASRSILAWRSACGARG
jgi:hypothetical protein